MLLSRTFLIQFFWPWQQLQQIPEKLEKLAGLCCKFVFDDTSKRPTGLQYSRHQADNEQPIIHDHTLFEAVANNPHLPDDYKEVMVLRPGVQGKSEIVGDWRTAENEKHKSHVYEYLRRNSYIPWGHYAANMAEDAIRYRIDDFSQNDMAGVRHLYYQRSYVRLAEELGIAVMARWKCLNKIEIEELRRKVVAALVAREAGFSGSASGNRLTATLWGWNYGFDIAASGYRLHASHQQIHQQYAMIQDMVLLCRNGEEDQETQLPTFACGDMVTEFIRDYRQETGHDFFKDYLHAIRNNRRLDGNSDERDSLIVYEDEHVILFVPRRRPHSGNCSL